MLELQDIIEFTKHVGAGKPLDHEFDVRKMDVPVRFKPHFEPFRHRIYAIILSTGQGDVQINNQVAGKPLVFLKIPYQIVTAEHLNGGITGYFIGFTESFLFNHKALVSLVFNLPFFSLDKAGALAPDPTELRLLEKLYQQILKEYHSTRADRFEMIVTYLQTLLLHMRRIYERSEDTICQTVKKGTQNDLAVAGRFKFLLNSCFKELEESHVSRTVAYYANKLAVHPNQLNAAVKKATGKTAHELLQEQIILFAKDLLLKTNMSIKEIAYQLSFNAPSHFVSFFKKNTSHTPSQFRTYKTDYL